MGDVCGLTEARAWSDLPARATSLHLAAACAHVRRRRVVRFGSDVSGSLMGWYLSCVLSPGLGRARAAGCVCTILDSFSSQLSERRSTAVHL